jgi:hypothetical protein
VATDLATLGIVIDSSQAKNAATDLDKLKQSAGGAEGAVKTLTGAFSRFSESALSLKTAFQAVIAAAPLIMLKDMIESVVEGRAQLERLAAQAGTTAEGLGRFAAPAAKANSSLDDVSHAMFMVSRAMQEARDPLSRGAQGFASIGIGIDKIKASSPDQMFELVARKLALFSDGAQKNAVMQELLGRSGYAMAAVMKEVAASTELVSKTTNEQAEQAKKLEQQWTQTRIALEATKKHLVDEMMPQLQDVSGAVLQAAKDSGLLMAAWVALGGVAASIFGLNKTEAQKLASAIKDAEEHAADLRQQISKGPKDLGDGIFDRGPINAYKIELDAVVAQIRFLKEMQTATSGGYQDQVSRATAARSAAAADPTKGPNFDPAAVQRLTDAMKAYQEIAGKASGVDGDYLEKLRQLDLVRASITKRYGVDSPEMKQYIAVVEAYIKTQPGYIENEKAKAEAAKSTTAALMEQAKVTQQMNDVESEFKQSMKDQAADQKFENSLIGQSAESIQKLTAARRIDLELRASIAKLPGLSEDASEKQVQAYADAVENLTKAATAAKAASAGLVDQNIALQQQVAFWNQVADAAAGFFTAMMSGGKSAIDYLRNLFKQLLAEMIALFAKRWVLNFAVGGSSLLGAAAEALAGTGAGGGGGGTAGQLLSLLSGSSTAYSAATGAGTLGSLYNAYWLGAHGGTMVGASGATGAANSLGATIGPYMGYIGAGAGIAAGLATSYSLYNSGWKGTNPGVNNAGFISGTPIWSPAGGLTRSQESIFRALGMSDRNAAIFGGTTGIQRLFGWKDPEAISQGITGSVSGSSFGGQNYVDWKAKGGLFRGDKYGTDTSAFSSDQSTFFSQLMSGVTNVVGSLSRLTGAPGTALDGYSHDYKLDFKGKSDAEIQTMLGDLLGSVLREQTSQVLKASGNTELSKWVDDLKGTSDEVTHAIMDLVDTMDALKHSTIKGLDINSLKAWQQDGESFGDTLQRVMGAFAQFDDAFMSDAQKLQAAQDQVTDAFKSMGIAIPASSAAFYDLVHSIDVSTEAGRTLVEQLLQVAPAFQQVEQATAAAVANMYNSAASLSSSFGSSYAQANLQAAAEAWRAIPGAAGNGWSTQQIIQEIGGLVQGGTTSNPGGFTDALHYVQSLGPAAVSAFNNLLDAYRAAQGASQQTTQSFQPLTSGISNLGNAAQDAAQKMADAQSSLRSYLDSLLGDAGLSPLSPLERLGAARNSFEALVAQAASGDTNAMSQLAGAHRAYLQIAREVYASGAQYVDIFNQSTGELAGVSGYGAANWQQAMANALPRTSPMASQGDIHIMTRILVTAIAGAAAANDASVEQQTEALQPSMFMVRR